MDLLAYIALNPCTWVLIIFLILNGNRKKRIALLDQQISELEARRNPAK